MIRIAAGSFPRSKPRRLLWRQPIQLPESIEVFPDAVVVRRLHELTAFHRETGAPVYDRKITGMSSFALFRDGDALVHFCDEELTSIRIDRLDPGTGAAVDSVRVPGTSFRSWYERGTIAIVDERTLRVGAVSAAGASFEWMTPLPFRTIYASRVDAARTLVSISGPEGCAVYDGASNAEIWRAASGNEVHCVGAWGFAVEAPKGVLELRDREGHVITTLEDPRRVVAADGSTYYRGFKVVAENARWLVLVAKHFSRTTGFGSDGFFLWDHTALFSQPSWDSCAEIYDDGFVRAHYGRVTAHAADGAVAWALTKEEWLALGLSMKPPEAITCSEGVVYVVTHDTVAALG